MKLLIDIGNTAIKMAMLNYQQEIIPFLTISSRKLISQKDLQQTIINALDKIALTHFNFKLLCLSSVRPIWDQLFYQLTLEWNLLFYQVKKNLSVKRLKIDLPNPLNVGADLIVASYATLDLFACQDIIIINMGTATTISLLKTNVLSGIIIMPGLEIAAQALFEHAELLQKFDYAYEIIGFGTNTEQAINIGLVKGHLLAITGFIDKLSKQLTTPQVILTGGNAIYVKDFVNYFYDQNLIFKGLKAILIDNRIM